MKLTLPLLIGAALALAPPAAERPDAVASLTLPESSLQLRVAWRQLPPDLAVFSEGEGLSAGDLKRLQVASLLAQGASLQSDAFLRVGDRVLEPGRYGLFFTVGVGGRMNFALVDGADVVPLSSEPLEFGWASERLLLQLQWISRHEARLIWQLGRNGGSFRLVLGTRDAEPPFLLDER